MERRNIRNANSNTRNNYIGDNLARKLNREDTYVSERKKKEQARLQKMRAAKRKERLIRNISVAAASVIVIGFCVTLLSTISRNNELTSQVNRINNQIEELKILNDAKEYDIDGSVDLDYVVQVATQELGMVRGSASQIVTYETQNSEYVQQVAEIPTE